VSMVPKLKAPVEAGLPLGRLEVFIGETKVMEMGITLEDTIPEKAWGDWLHEIVRGWRLSNILNISP